MEALSSSNRTKRIVEARNIAMYLCRSLLNLTFSRIAELFARNTHNSAMSGIKKAQKLISDDTSFESKVEAIKRIVAKSTL
jgi:chromosomal replication initiator protein